MNKNVKKKISLLLSAVMLITIINIVPIAFGDDLVALNSNNFPDTTFIRLIEQEYDKNLDGFLSADERSTTEMDVSGMVAKANWIDNKQDAIHDLKGIEHFSNLKILHCGAVGLTSLDTSSLAELTELYCGGNYLESVDVLRNLKLEVLHCADNMLKDLRLPGYSTTLTTLHCYANFIEVLDTSSVPNLTDLRCDQNELTSLNLSNNTKLTTLKCSYNHLTSLDLSKTAIKHISNADISNQEVEAAAVLSNENTQISIPFGNRGLNTSNYAGSSLDGYDDTSGFSVDTFTATDVSQIADGITYDCYPMLEAAENMTVKINVSRNFYQVDFYTSDTLTEKLGKVFVTAGGSAAAPIVTEMPQCRRLDRWSSDLACISEDMSVYPIYAEDHNYTSVVLENDGDTVTVTCQHNDSSYQVSFISIVNSKTNDASFDENVDVVKDGYINAKDYAVLLKAGK